MAKDSSIPALDHTDTDDTTTPTSAPADTARPFAVRSAVRPRSALAARDRDLHLMALAQPPARTEGQRLRQLGRLLSAQIWTATTRGEGAAIARRLDVDASTVSRWGTDERPVALADVLALDPRTSARVLLAALDHVEGQPARGEGVALAEVIWVSRTMLEITWRLEQCRPEVMSVDARHELADLIDRCVERLRRLARRLRGGGR